LSFRTARAATQEFRVFERRRVVEASHLRKEGHAAEEVAASVGQGVMACRLAGDRQGDADGTLADQVQLVARVAKRVDLLVLRHRASLETFASRSISVSSL
jgi:hypothetical protein